MLMVRKAAERENKIRNEGPVKKKRSKENIKIEEKPMKSIELTIEDTSKTLQAEEKNNEDDEDMLVETFSEEDEIIPPILEKIEEPVIKILQSNDKTKEQKRPISSLENTETNSRRRPCANLNEDITITDYKLLCKEKNGQNVINIEVNSKSIKPNQTGYYDFEWFFSAINHHDESSVYSCTHCVKAFSSCELLFKHLTLCHLCLFCLKILDNYKSMSQHVREQHEKIICPFCKKCFSSSNYRQHIKKQHILNLPYYIGIFPSIL